MWITTGGKNPKGDYHTAEENIIDGVPSFMCLVSMLYRNKLLFILSSFLAFCVGLVILRILPKGYESVAVVATRPVDAENPAKKWEDPNLSQIEPEKYALTEFKSSLFSYDIVARAAKETGMLDIERDGLRETLAQILWKLVGGKFEESPEALERNSLDHIRFNCLDFERLNTSSQNNTASRLNYVKVAMTYSDPIKAQKFLQQLLELYKKKLEKEDLENSIKLTKIYDEFVSQLGSKIKNTEGDPKAARVSLQEIDGIKEELKLKLKEEADLRSKMDTELAKIKQEMAEVETKFTSKHPSYEKARVVYEQTESKLKGTLGRVTKEVTALKARLDKSFQELLNVSSSTFEGAGALGEGHSEYLTKERTELRGLSKVYELVQERYIQAIVQNRINEAQADDRFNIIENASRPLRPIKPKLISTVFLLLLGSLFFGGLASMQKELFDGRIRSRWLLGARSKLPIWQEQTGKSDSIVEKNKAPVEMDSESFLAERKLPQARGGDVLRNELSFLITKMASYQQGYPAQFGVIPMSAGVPSAPVAFNIAFLLAKETTDKKKVLIVSTRNSRSILDLLMVDNEKLLENNLCIFDVSKHKIDAELLRELAINYSAIVWDLPSFDILAWNAVELPCFPLVGVVEYDSSQYGEIKSTAEWLGIMAKERDFPVGIYVTKKGKSSIKNLFGIKLDLRA